MLEKEVKVDSIFAENEMLDVLGVTKGKGFAGVIKRFGVKHLQKKTHRGYRSVVSVHGILPESDSLSPELVNWVITTEPKPTRRFTESVRVMMLPMLPLLVMSLIRLSLLWVVSPTMVSSRTISS
ncbi:50S ribosomal protein L3 [Salmonella sp. zj-f77]|nr:50S ribosomal protein L3 [Salmonella sp. zj-f77]